MPRVVNGTSSCCPLPEAACPSIVPATSMPANALKVSPSHAIENCAVWSTRRVHLNSGAVDAASSASPPSASAMFSPLTTSVCVSVAFTAYGDLGGADLHRDRRRDAGRPRAVHADRRSPALASCVTVGVRTSRRASGRCGDQRDVGIGRRAARVGIARRSWGSALYAARNLERSKLKRRAVGRHADELGADQPAAADRVLERAREACWRARDGRRGHR